MPARSFMERPPPPRLSCSRRLARLLSRGLPAALIGVGLPALPPASTPAALAQVSEANGGLTQDVPSACMVQTTSGGGGCLLRSSAQGVLFRFHSGPQ